MKKCYLCQKKEVKTSVDVLKPVYCEECWEYLSNPPMDKMIQVATVEVEPDVVKIENEGSSMKLKVTSRDNWTKEMQEKFGECGSEYEFPNSTQEFLKDVVSFGRFQISSDLTEIEFQNGYD